ncbi:MAG: class F sortase [Actinomycetia bacterium]|nr:class F sortase [Actinomycetes bacterium]
MPINVSLVSNGIDWSAGALVIPTNPALATIWDRRTGSGVTPGGPACNPTQGSTVIAGHVSYNGKKGALYYLKNVGGGAMAYIGCGDGTVSSWRLSRTFVVDQNALPSSLWSHSGAPTLYVVTCTGPTAADGTMHQNFVAVFSKVS